MPKFYGIVEGFSETVASRRGNNFIKSSAQSYDGSVITRLNYGNDGRLMIDIMLSDDSSSDGDTEFYGTLDELKECFRDYKKIEEVNL